MGFAGIDLGTVFTKMSNGEKFPSGVSKYINAISSNILEYDGCKHSMEIFNSHADYDVNLNKSLNFNTKLNFIYALGKFTPENEKIYQNVIVGLPVNQWKNDRTVEEFKKYLCSEKIINFSINGIKKSIQIDNLNVIPEGSSSYYAMEYFKFNGKRTLVLDWGGLTLNQLLYEDDALIDFHSDEYGCLKIYQKMAEKITTTLGIDIKTEDMYDYSVNGLFLQGKQLNIKEIVKDIGLQYCKEIYRGLKLRWNIDTIPYVPMVGGASIVMIDYIKALVPHAELQTNAQQLSALGMEVML